MTTRETRTLLRVFSTISLAAVKQSGLGPVSRQMLLSTWKRTVSGKPRGQLACREKYLQTGMTFPITGTTQKSDNKSPREFSITVYAVFHDARRASTEDHRAYSSHT